MPTARTRRPPQPHIPTPTGSTPAPDIPKGIEAIPADWLLDVPGTTDKVAEVGSELGLTRDDGSPSQNGDVLSIQPTGALQTRPAGACGNYERAAVDGNWLVYRPVGVRCFLVPLATAFPNE